MTILIQNKNFVLCIRIAIMYQNNIELSFLFYFGDILKGCSHLYTVFLTNEYIVFNKNNFT